MTEADILDGFKAPTNIADAKHILSLYFDECRRQNKTKVTYDNLYFDFGWKRTKRTTQILGRALSQLGAKKIGKSADGVQLFRIPPAEAPTAEEEQYERTTVAEVCAADIGHYSVFHNALNSKLTTRGFILPQFLYVAFTGTIKESFALNIGLTEDQAVNALKSDMDYITKHAFTPSAADIKIIVLPLKTIIDR